LAFSSISSSKVNTLAKLYEQDKTNLEEYNKMKAGQSLKLNLKKFSYCPTWIERRSTLIKPAVQSTDGQGDTVANPDLRNCSKNALYVGKLHSPEIGLPFSECSEVKTLWRNKGFNWLPASDSEDEASIDDKRETVSTSTLYLQQRKSRHGKIEITMQYNANNI
jgi:hypothetical protein